MVGRRIPAGTVARIKPIIARRPRACSVRAMVRRAFSRCFSDSASFFRIWGGTMVQRKSWDLHMYTSIDGFRRRERPAGHWKSSAGRSENVSLRFAKIKILNTWIKLAQTLPLFLRGKVAEPVWVEPLRGSYLHGT